MKPFRSRLVLTAGCALALVLAGLLGSSLAGEAPAPQPRQATMTVPF